MNLDADICILGGGCAGLSLAVALCEYAPHLSVQILDSRSQYTRDRTWCFWNAEPHPFTSCVSHSWSRWSVQAVGQLVQRQSARYRYEHIPADRFYAFALQRIAGSPNQKLSLNVRAGSITPDRQSVAVETSSGRIRARLVFDSRPPPLSPWRRTGLLQRFTGWHVHTGNPCFNPEVVELMDFQPPTLSGRTTFFYTLPFTPNEALVEATYLDWPDLTPIDAESDLKRRLQNLTGDRYEILYRENGTLPMSCAAPPPTPPNICTIGRLGGRLKPSSGYAFLRIQRQSRALARALAASAPLPKFFEPRFYSALDRIFLEALQHRPEAASNYLVPLFRDVPADTLVRFLSESGTLQESLEIGLALPALPFLQAAAFSLMGAAA